MERLQGSLTHSRSIRPTRPVTGVGGGTPRPLSGKGPIVTGGHGGSFPLVSLETIALARRRSQRKPVRRRPALVGGGGPGDNRLLAAPDGHVTRGREVTHALALVHEGHQSHRVGQHLPVTVLALPAVKRHVDH